MTRFAALTGAFFLIITATFGAVATAQDVDTSTIPDMTIGDENAPIKIVEYASYTCPHCASFHEGSYKKLKAEYIDTGKVHFTFREVYFDRFGLWASMIARCAGPDRFFGVTDMVFTGQQDWARAGDPQAIVGELRKIGLLAGVTNDELDQCLQDNDKARTLVAWYQENVERDDISATPSFIVNGKPVENQSWESFKAILEGELNG